LKKSESQNKIYAQDGGRINKTIFEAARKLEKKYKEIKFGKRKIINRFPFINFTANTARQFRD
jgi:hypothetical protein